MACQIGWNSNTLSLSLGKRGILVRYKEKSNQNRSGSGKIETIHQHGIVEVEAQIYITESQYRAMVAWWSWARQGKAFSFAFDSTDTANTTLDDSAASGQKVIPLTATTGLAVGDQCLIRAEDADDEFEIIKIASISAGVNVTAEDNLYYSYASGDTFRHFNYFPSVVLLDTDFDPRQQPVNLRYTHTIKFAELL